ncbi:MAG: 6-pyruvoyl tetrahydropterin synthase [Rickettsiales bacterium]|nr:6-pyruvoyl tetrahydropterin synthase [Rickettsiales bacterium]MAH81079.1 6-pyruvoyl tetrahydropterin synthase [Rickettsiales bacterium]|tara:strand:- start:3034 stop:3405 length:372 start_codon:yes stop_codon:yes gene_type:complete
MYDVSVSTSFVAQHYLIGGDFGAENIKHSHNFKIQLIIENDILNTHNYVVDIDDIKNFLTKIEKTYKDQCLNDFKIFKNQNPSIEFFAKVIFDDFNTSVNTTQYKKIKVIVFEDENCYASYQN